MIAPSVPQCERTGVIICGGGPTGVVLSALLGRMEVPNIVLERDPEITTDPRGIVLDEDGIRVLQALGLYEKVFTEIGSSMDRFMFVTGTEKDLSKTPMTSIDYSTSEGGTGHPGFLCHKQPILEASVRGVISKSRFSEIRTNSTVIGISEDDEQVTVTYTDAEGVSHQISAAFLVGADGKTGYVRKKYLEPRGVHMEKCEGTNYEQTWVALNWQITLPTEKSHPDFPLWRLGYSPQQVYDLFFPDKFRFLCNPRRPSVCGRFGLPEDRLWRFEFVVYDHEDGTKMASEEEIFKIILPYHTHPGSRYGLSQSVTYPLDCIKTLRSRPFYFSARSCNRWALKRVIICGDAAHVFPPFGGQGIASGFRDSFALGWRLALLWREGNKIDHEELLGAWYKERKQQFDRSLAATIVNGAYVTEADPLKCFWREWYLWAVQLVPWWRRELEKGPRAAGMTRYRHQPGFAFVDGFHGGLLLPQVYAYDFQANEVTFSDDLLFSPAKRGFLHVLLLPTSEQELQHLLDIVENVEPQSHGYIRSDETTILFQDLQAKPNIHGRRTARIASGEEFSSHPRLCKNRPAPIYYDPYRIMTEVGGAKIVIVRRDRFVYAAVSTREELSMALGQLKTCLHIR